MTPGMTILLCGVILALLLWALREGVRADRAEARLDVVQRRRERGLR